MGEGYALSMMAKVGLSTKMTFKLRLNGKETGT